MLATKKKRKRRKSSVILMALLPEPVVVGAKLKLTWRAVDGRDLGTKGRDGMQCTLAKMMTWRVMRGGDRYF